MSDIYDLQRFVDAQGPVYDAVLDELGAGRKRSHWMWFVFPQLRALGHSATAQHFGISSRGEAEAYWRHPLLGARLSACTALVLANAHRSALAIFGSPDDLKFGSAVTLFAEVALGAPLFRQAIEQFFGGRPDVRTLALLDSEVHPHP